MERTSWLLVLCVILVKSFCGFQSGVKEDFVETVNLSSMVSLESCASSINTCVCEFFCDWRLPVDEQQLLGGRRLSRHRKHSRCRMWCS